MNKKILIRGAGEMASAVAHRLFRCGFSVVMTEIARPTAVRRAVSFCSAVYDGEIEIEGVKGVLCESDVAELKRSGRRSIPVLVDPRCEILRVWEPEVLVDGRLLKHNPDTRISDAALVIALGPGFYAGRDAHFVIETNRGHNLGRIITSGAASDDTFEPGNIGGYTYERLLRAPAAGIFTGVVEIGAQVKKGEVIGVVAGKEVRAQIAGVLRGIVHPGIEVVSGQKLGDVDPRGTRSYCFTLTDKSRTISGSVLEIVVNHVCGKN